MVLVKKYLAEAIGTFFLVFIGCGTAMTVGCDSASGAGYLITALAFGLAIVAIAYSVGNISGGHVNPAVSLAFAIRGDLSWKDFVGYVISQVIGAIVGSACTALIFSAGKVTDMTGGFGSNGLAGVSGSVIAGLLVEIVLTFIFVSAIMGVTSKKQNHGSFGGLVIALTLAAVHLIGIGLTGTSVNPARSLGPAIIALFSGNTDPIAQVFVFIIAPLIGGALAAIVYKAIESEK